MAVVSRPIDAFSWVGEGLQEKEQQQKQQQQQQQ